LQERQGAKWPAMSGKSAVPNRLCGWYQGRRRSRCSSHSRYCCQCKWRRSCRSFHYGSFGAGFAADSAPALLIH
jgi:hypothetical protein